MILTGAEVRSGGTTVNLIGVEHVKGDLAPERLIGRLPSGPDEVALGRVTAGDLGLEVGDELALTGPGGDGVYRVVGLAVVPGFAGYSGVGVGGVVTAEGLLRLEPEPDASLAAIALRPDAPDDTRGGSPRSSGRRRDCRILPRRSRTSPGCAASPRSSPCSSAPWRC